jgi:hypothetical protein
MARDASVEETFRELEESIRRARRRIEELKQARVNIILDRIDSLG